MKIMKTVRIYRCSKCRKATRLSDSDALGKIIRCAFCAQEILDARTFPIHTKTTDETNIHRL